MVESNIAKFTDAAICIGEQTNLAVLFPLSGRHEKFGQITSSHIPKEFFYGSEALIRSGASIHFFDSRMKPSRLSLRYMLRFEYYVRRFQNFPISLCRVEGLRPELLEYGKIVSFTDYLSLGLGLSNIRKPFQSKLVGGFHGLADVFHGQKPSRQNYIRKKIIQSLNGLDKIFFLGDEDEEESKRLFNICRSKIHRFRFGVDTAFWCPAYEPEGDYVFSVGSDVNRDYPCLIDGCATQPLKIVTKLKLEIPKHRKNIEVLAGSLHEPSISDIQLRDLYRRAKIIVVPVKNVFQPSGQSVTLQAMSSGRPVILTRTKGLWDRNIFVSGVNCILVPPKDPGALKEAIDKLSNSPNLRKKIGKNARYTAIKHFGISRMNTDFETIVG